MADRRWNILLLLNIIVPLAGGIVLFAFPAFVPATVGIPLEPDQRLMAYLIGAAEFAVVTLCVLALRSPRAEMRRVTAWTMIVFHGFSGLATVIAYAQGVSPAVLINTAARIVMVVLFAWWGLGGRSNVQVGDA